MTLVPVPVNGAGQCSRLLGSLTPPAVDDTLCVALTSKQLNQPQLSKKSFPSKKLIILNIHPFFPPPLLSNLGLQGGQSLSQLP